METLTWHYCRWVCRPQHGQDLTEYALLIALLALAGVAAIKLLGNQTRVVFTKVTTSVG